MRPTADFATTHLEGVREKNSKYWYIRRCIECFVEDEILGHEGVVQPRSGAAYQAVYPVYLNYQNEWCAQCLYCKNYASKSNTSITVWRNNLWLESNGKSIPIRIFLTPICKAHEWEKIASQPSEDDTAAATCAFGAGSRISSSALSVNQAIDLCEKYYDAAYSKE